VTVPEGRSDALRAMLDEGRKAWPSVELEREVFEKYLQELPPSSTDRSDLHAADLYLACACSHGDPQALAEFERGYLSAVPAFLARAKPSPTFVDDVMQQLRERLFVEGKVKQYSGRGALGGWLRVVAARVAANLRKQEKPHAELTVAIPATAADPELRLIQQRYGEQFRVALSESLVTLDAEDRNLLRLFYLDGLNIGRIAVVFQVSRATIGRRMVEVRERLIAETQRLLGVRLKATQAELESLLRVVRSDLAMSLSVILRDRT
jgi:RNA polymerase sigma-70 factor (ECF subfamily)